MAQLDPNKNEYGDTHAVSGPPHLSHHILCWCKPDVEVKDTATGAEFWWHNAFVFKFPSP